MLDGKNSSGGIGILGMLGVVFVLAKVFGVQPIAAWSWVWVLAPFWGPFAFMLALLAVLCIVAVLASFLRGLTSGR